QRAELRPDVRARARPLADPDPAGNLPPLDALDADQLHVRGYAYTNRPRLSVPVSARPLSRPRPGYVLCIYSCGILDAVCDISVAERRVRLYIGRSSGRLAPPAGIRRPLGQEHQLRVRVR